MARKWIEVESSAIEAYSYDAKKEQLYIKYKSGKNPQWRYSPVSKKDLELFLNSESKGQFLHKHIKYNAGIKAEKVDE